MQGHSQGYPRTYRAVQDLIRRALLESRTARAVARKGLGPFEAVPGASVASGPRLLAQFGSLDVAGKAEGYSFNYPDGSDPFSFPDALYSTDPNTPGGSGFFQVYLDSRGLTECRLIVCVIEAGESGSSLSARFEAELFATCPMDTLGLHDSGWVPIVLPVAPDPLDSVLVDFVVSNPSLAASSATVGLIQFHGR